MLSDMFAQLIVLLIRHLIDTLNIDSKALAEMASAEYGIPVFDVSAMNRDLLPDHQISNDMMVQHHAVPLFRRGNRLFVAVSDPMNLAALNEFKFAADMNTDAVLADDAALNQLIRDIAEGSNGLDRDMAALSTDDQYDLEMQTSPAEEEANPHDAADDTPIVRFVNKILLDAIRQGASDIHFEPYEKIYRVRFRTDGILREVVKPPRNPRATSGGTPEGDVADGYFGASRTSGRADSDEALQETGD